MNTSKEMQVAKLLKDLGISPALLGYNLLKYAVLYMWENPKKYGQITKELYPAVSAKFDTIPQRAERTIRHAIEVGYLRGNFDTYHEIFGYTISDRKGKPTNSEFITTVADYLRMCNNGTQHQYN